MVIYSHYNGEPNTSARVLPQKTLPSALRVHPKGFRVLSHRSPVERCLVSYFRVPPPPAKHKEAEAARVSRMLKMKGRGAGPGDTSKKKKQVDGFVLLKACGVSDPDDGVEASIADRGYVGVVSEDLAYFPNLEFLDAGENAIDLHALAPLAKLEELHLHCCQLRQLQVSRDDFHDLSTLNLSFNCFSDAAVVATLAQLPSLARLDLSGNRLESLPDPEAMGRFRCLTQLALENNRLRGDGVFAALSAVATLIEANLNGNRLSRVPAAAAGDDDNNASAADLFPSLQVIGLADNNFNYFEDLYALVKFNQLKRAVIWGNPLQRRRHDLEILIFELGKVNVQAYIEGPLPPKKSVGVFYTANAKNMVKVGHLRTRGRPKGDAAKKQAAAGAGGAGNGDAKSEAEEEDAASDRGGGVVANADAGYAPTFFMTEPALGSEVGAGGLSGRAPAPPQTPGVGEDSVLPPHTLGRKVSRQTAASDVMGSSRSPPAAAAQDDAWFTVDGGLEGELELGGGSGRSNVLNELDELLNAPTPTDLQDSKLLSKNRKPSTVRRAFRELKQALRQPITAPASTTLVSRRRGKRRANYTNVYATRPEAAPSSPPLQGNRDTTATSRLPPL